MTSTSRLRDERWIVDERRTTYVCERDGWLVAMSARPIPRTGRTMCRFTALDPENFAYNQTKDVSGLRSRRGGRIPWLRREAARILAGLVEDGTRNGVLEIRDPLGWLFVQGERSTPETDEIDPGRTRDRTDPHVSMLFERMSPGSPGFPRAADVMEADGAWPMSMSHLDIGRLAATRSTEGLARGRFGPHARHWILPEQRRFVRAVHRLCPWLPYASVDTSRFLELMHVQREDVSPDDMDERDVARTLERVVSYGGSFAPWPVQPLAIRSLRDHWSDLRQVEHRGLLEVLRMASALPASWMPKTVDAWRHVEILTVMLWRSAMRSPERIRSFLAHTKGDWPRMFAELGCRDDDPDDLEALLASLFDVVDDVRDRVVAPILDRDGSPTAKARSFGDLADRIAAVMVLSDAGIVELKRRSDRWHAVVDRLPVPSEGAAPNSRWPKLTEDFACSSGTLCFLDVAQDVVEEGEALNHCVASYVDRCRSGHAHVASIRSIAGERLSTVQVSVRAGAPHVVQHRGRRNTAPPEEAVAILDAWLETTARDKVLAGVPDTKSGDWHVRRYRRPEAPDLRDWRGILQRRIVRMTWDELEAEIDALAASATLPAFDGRLQPKT